MSDMSRRDLVTYMAAFPFLLSVEGGAAALDRAMRRARGALDDAGETGQAFVPEFFTAHEWRTVRLLTDLILPGDERSGSATDAGVPEFMDFMMLDQPGSQDWMRSGLEWLDAEAGLRWGPSFVDCEPRQRRWLLDDIAWPERAPPAVVEGVRFFNRFRDLTASGFWSSEMGVADLEYIGNTFVPAWTGCPPSALRKLGVSYEDWPE